jgi:hypothetical protein
MSRMIMELAIDGTISISGQGNIIRMTYVRTLLPTPRYDIGSLLLNAKTQNVLAYAFRKSTSRSQVLSTFRICCSQRTTLRLRYDEYRMRRSG